MNSLEIKAELLCYGIKLNEFAEKAFLEQNPFGDKRTGNPGLQIEIGEIVINTAIGHKYTEKSPYTILNKEDRWLLEKNDKQVSEFSLIKAPKWCLGKCSDGTPFSQLAVHEGRNTLGVDIYNSCDYFKIGEQCKFCGINYDVRVKKKDPKKLAECIEVATKENPNYDMDWTGGNTLTPDRGLLNYLEPMKEVRKVSKNPIVLEASPPEENKYFDILLDAGASNFNMNIELWNDVRRKEICPAKSKISKKRYFESWNYCSDKIGKDSMTTLMIVGLEDKEDTVEGIDILTSKGVIPSFIPFHPNDGCVLQNEPPCKPLLLLELSEKLGNMLKEKGLNPFKHVSCSRCTACTLETDFMR